MGPVQPKCCATQNQDAPNTMGEAAAETKLLGDQPIPPVGKPLWLAEAEEFVALQKQKEADQARRIQQLADERAEEERKAKENAEKKAEEDAKAKEVEKKKKTSASSTKKPPAKSSTPNLEDQVKTKASPPVAAVAEPPALSAPPEEQKSKEAEQQQKIDEAVKASKDLADAKFEFEVKCVSARGLRDADWLEGTSDPYCLCEAVGKVKSKFKTKTVNNKENPVWNQAAKMQLCRGDKLKFSIFDQDTGKADDFLGYAELDYEKLSIGFEGELALKDASDTAQKVEAYIKVRVRNLGACAPK